MRFRRFLGLMVATALAGVLGMTAAAAGPLAVVANFTDPSLLNVSQPPWPGGTVTIIDTATDRQVGTPIKVGANPQAVAITPDGRTAVVACSQDSELYFIDLSGATPALLGKLSVGTGSGDTFYPAGLTISPDGEYVAVTSLVGSAGVPLLGIPPVNGEINKILLVSIPDRQLVQTLDLGSNALTAEAAAFTARGSLIAVGPSTRPEPVIYALGYANGLIVEPEVDEETQLSRLGGFRNATGLNVTVSPDSSFALVPLGGSKLDLFHVDESGAMTIGKELIDSGGEGAHSIAISSDARFVYVRNMLPPQANIAVFEVIPGPDLKDTGLRLKAEGVSEAVLQFQGYQPGALGFVGSQTIAVTPDGRKIYAANPFGGRPAGLLGLYGAGNVLVFDPTKPDAIRRLEFVSSLNPIAVAIQPQ
jgi:DNA-binding beta-propeller fold protein YncE